MIRDETQAWHWRCHTYKHLIASYRNADLEMGKTELWGNEQEKKAIVHHVY